MGCINLLEQCFGAMFWSNVLEQCFGAMFWSNVLIKNYKDIMVHGFPKTFFKIPVLREKTVSLHVL